MALQWVELIPAGQIFLMNVITNPLLISNFLFFPPQPARRHPIPFHYQPTLSQQSPLSVLLWCPSFITDSDSSFRLQVNNDLLHFAVSGALNIFYSALLDLIAVPSVKKSLLIYYLLSFIAKFYSRLITNKHVFGLIMNFVGFYLSSRINSLTWFLQCIFNGAWKFETI